MPEARRTMTAKEAREATKAELQRRQLSEETRDAAQAGLPPPIVDLDEEELAEVGGAGRPTANTTGAPEWAKLPADILYPVGWLVWYVRFPGDLTCVPGKGERQCILWNLSESDEKLAARRARGDGARIIDEMAKQTIRAVDGVVADPAMREVFWNEIGGKCRHQLKSLYLKNHTMDEKENADFFASCIAPRTAG